MNEQQINKIGKFSEKISLEINDFIKKTHKKRRRCSETF